MFKHHIKHTITVLENKHLPTPLKVEVFENQSIILNHTQPEISQFLDDLQNYIRDLFEEKKPGRHEHYKMFSAGLNNLLNILRRYPEKELLKEKLEIFTLFFMTRYDNMPEGQEILFTLAQYIERI